MNQNLDEFKIEIKQNINFLINNGKLEEAKDLLEKYNKMVIDDIESYSIESVILILENNYEQARIILKKGLEKDLNNFDILYNLAYLYEIDEDYLNSLIYYKKALVKNYYDVDVSIIKNKIYELKEKIQNKKEDNMDLYISSIENILFIDINQNKKMYNIAKRLNKYGFNIDIAYMGNSPVMNIGEKENPYRKMIGITELNGLVDYIEYYKYDSIYFLDIPNKLKKYFKIKKIKILDKDISGNRDEEMIKYFFQNKLSFHNENLCENNIYNDISIIIPTYNRQYYLNRILTFISNYKYIKPRIIVLDSSEEDKRLKNEKIIEKFKDRIDVEYRSFSSELIPLKKFNFGIQNVKTKYMALCPDDDFLTEEGIIESIKFLEQNTNMYSVKGKNLYFIESMGNLYEYDWFEILEDDNPINRLKKITEGFVPSVLYQVFVAEKFKKLYKFLDEKVLNLPWNTFIEYLIYFIIIADGKIGKINVDLNIRDKGAEKYKRTYNFPDAIKDKTFNEKYNLFKTLLREYLIYIGESIDNYDDDIINIFSNFLVNFLQIPKEFVEIKNDEFNFEKLEKGITKSWVFLR